MQVAGVLRPMMGERVPRIAQQKEDNLWLTGGEHEHSEFSPSAFMPWLGLFQLRVYDFCARTIDILSAKISLKRIQPASLWTHRVDCTSFPISIRLEKRTGRPFVVF